MLVRSKNWDRHVAEAEEMARAPGFQLLRDRILALAHPQEGDVVVDVGAGTGLLSLALARTVRKVWAVDISPSMGGYLRTKAGSGELHNIEVVTASATSLPLVDAIADLLVSNYCYHHLRDRDKERALAEALRVLRPGGRLVIGDMIFRVGLRTERDRRILADKVAVMLGRGPQGLLRLLKNVARYLGGRWEHPAGAQWWQGAIRRAGFEDVEVEVLDHEGGIATARRPSGTS